MADTSGEQLLNLAQQTGALVITLLVLGYCSVLLRLWVRLRITKNTSWDDATMVLSLCLFTCYSAFILVIVYGSTIDHLTTEKSIRRIILYIHLSEIFYIFTTTTLKISLGLFFLRVLTKRWQVIVFHTIIGVSAVYGSLYSIVSTFQCGPPSNLVDSVFEQVKCLPDWFLLASGYLYGIINVFADWTFVLIPIVLLLETNMDRRSKISVCIIMGLGAIGSISSILRMVFLKGLRLHLTGFVDALKATIWATAEPGTGIIAASIATLRPLFRQITADVRERVSDYKSSKHSRNASTQSTARNKSASNRDSMIALTTTNTAELINNNRLKKTPAIYPIESPTWVPNVTLEEARIRKVISIRITTDENPPPPPPKD